MKRTYQPSRIVRKRRHGFRSRMKKRVAERLLQEEEQKEEKKYLLKLSSKMIKFKSLNQSKEFLKILKKKK